MNAQRLIVSLSALTLIAFASTHAADRQDMLLTDQWKFIKDDVPVDAPVASWQDITIPHTWNTKEADEAGAANKSDPHFKDHYYRGACWYERQLQVPADWKDKRVFIRFEAASLVSKTYLNGHLLGEHRGGFTAFCYEMTGSLNFGGANELRVQVDNSHQEDVPPLSGDFNVDGGIYRPVHLIVTDKACISPLDYGSPGVFIKSSLDGKVDVQSVVSNPDSEKATLKTEITDADGKVVVSDSDASTVPAGPDSTVDRQLTVTNPHLWNGRKDPYLYHVKVSLIKEGTEIDSVVQPLGFRTVEISQTEGFLLNAKPYPIHGVNRHQDWGDHGWAATDENYLQDEQLILDMGVTAIRLAHYPQSDRWHDLCDHNGLLLWDEFTEVNEIRNTPEYKANADLQVHEMILQRFNHPSIAFWGFYNELDNVKPKITPEEQVAVLQPIKELIHQLDPSRLIVSATCHLKKAFNKIPDYLCTNIYPGWYSGWGTSEQFTKNADAYAAEFGKSVGISEYGAGANTTQHREGQLTQPVTTGPFHPEEWQTHVHERAWEQIKNDPHVWGSFLWVMFDFQVGSRHEGSLAFLNDKGMVTQDRKIKKDAYFFYQANWTDKPMVHIASSRMTPRKQAVTDVQVFSNCDSVELSVNGKSLGKVVPDDEKICTWTGVTLQPGANAVLATATTKTGSVTDTCQWILQP